MAVVRNNALVNGLSGSIGGLVFRQYNGKTILSGKGCSPHKQSEQQRENRSKFKQASAWAKLVMLNPERKAYYLRKAKQLKLPNAYTAALSDYMRKGEIQDIDAAKYEGKAGNVIRIKTRKKDFDIDSAKVTLTQADGTVLETGYAVKRDRDIFLYTASCNAVYKSPLTVRVEINEHKWNTVTAERILAQ